LNLGVLQYFLLVCPFESNIDMQLATVFEACIKI